jgi:L-asparaginase
VPPLKATFDPEVVQITLIPGLRPESQIPLLDASRVQGVILQTFGAGNVPDEGEFSFVPFIAAAVGAGLPVILTSQFPASSTIASPYETGAGAIRAGAIPTGNMTNSTAYVKFRWVLAQVASDEARGAVSADDRLSEIHRRMATPYVGELDVEPGA